MGSRGSGREGHAALGMETLRRGGRIKRKGGIMRRVAPRRGLVNRRQSRRMGASPSTHSSDDMLRLGGICTRWC